MSWPAKRLLSLPVKLTSAAVYKRWTRSLSRSSPQLQSESAASTCSAQRNLDAKVGLHACAARANGWIEQFRSASYFVVSHPVWRAQQRPASGRRVVLRRPDPTQPKPVDESVTYRAQKSWPQNLCTVVAVDMYLWRQSFLPVGVLLTNLMLLWAWSSEGLLGYWKCLFVQLILL